MSHQEEVVNDDAPHHWRNWISTGDAVQLLVIAAMIVVSYTRTTAKTEDALTRIDALSATVDQLHEALDQVRARQTMTPEAAARIGILETRLNILESERSEMNVRLTRIEDKIDELRKGR